MKLARKGLSRPSMTYRGPAAAALLAAFALTACGNLQGDSGFQPPQGWSATPALLGRAQAWTKKDGLGKQTLMLVKGDARHPDIFYNPQFALNTMHDVMHDTIKVCGDRSADHYLGVKANGAIIEGVAVSAGGARYAALYLRDSAKTPTDPQAERALRTLCPRAS